MDLIYEVNEKRFLDLDGSSYVGYGVSCFEIFNGYKKLLGQIYDLCSDFKIISELIDRLNKFKVSCLHFYDVAYDFICERY